MIKKSTLIILACALLLGGGVYYFDYRRSIKEQSKPAADSSKLAFNIPSAADISYLTRARPVISGESSVQLKKVDGSWQIFQPLQTGADSRAVDNIVQAITSARIEGTEPGSPDRLKVYGLDPPQVSLEFQLGSGAKHSIKLGNKDFTGASVYSVVDDGKEVSLLPLSLLTNADVTLQDLRDRSVLHFVSGNAASFTIKNSAGELAATKEPAGKNQQGQWKFTKPAATLADEAGVNALLGAVSNAKMLTIVSETPESLAKYGLQNPAISFAVADAHGKVESLLVGRKEGNEYFARDPSRPMVFRINEDIYKKLSQNFTDLRDKRLAHFNPAEVTRVELRNSSGTIICNRKSAEDWTIEAPAEQKGKSAGIWKLFSPLSTARGEEVLDHPPANVASQLAKPAIEASLTLKDGKKITIRLSGNSGASVYGQSSEGLSIFRLKKQIFEDLNFKPAELAY